jgi:hypothetical protein
MIYLSLNSVPGAGADIMVERDGKLIPVSMFSNQSADSCREVQEGPALEDYLIGFLAKLPALATTTTTSWRKLTTLH